MGLLNRKNKDEFFTETNDILIVFNDENGTSDIKRISDINEDSVIVTGKYNVPIADCEVTTGSDGRHFFYRAPAQSITEVRRLAQLENNIILNQITSYKPPHDHNKLDMTKIMLFILVFIAFIVMIFK